MADKHNATAASPEVLPVPTGTAVQTLPVATADPNDWRAKFADKFTDGKIKQADDSYRSANISVTIERVQQENLTYFIAEPICCKDNLI